MKSIKDLGNRAIDEHFRLVLPLEARRMLGLALGDPVLVSEDCEMKTVALSKGLPQDNSIDSLGRVVLPAKAHRLLGLKPGSSIRICVNCEAQAVILERI